MTNVDLPKLCWLSADFNKPKLFIELEGTIKSYRKKLTQLQSTLKSFAAIFNKPNTSCRTWGYIIQKQTNSQPIYTKIFFAVLSSLLQTATLITCCCKIPTSLKSYNVKEWQILLNFDKRRVAALTWSVATIYMNKLGCSLVWSKRASWLGLP